MKLIFNSRSSVAIITILYLITTGGLTMAQNDELSKLTEQDKIQKLKAQIAENKQKEAEAERAAFLAQFPTSNTTGLEGTVTLKEGAGYYAEILAYEALEKCAEKISATLKEDLNGNTTVILMGDANLHEESVLWERLNYKINICQDDLNKALENFKPISSDVKALDGVSAAFVAAPVVLGAVSDIVSFFKTNYTYTGRKVTLNKEGLNASIAKCLKDQNGNLTIILPEKYMEGKGALLTSLGTLTKHRNDLQTIRDNLNDKTNSKLKEIKELLVNLENREQIINEQITDAIKKGDEIDDLKKQLDEVSQEINANKVKIENLTSDITQLDKLLKATDELVKVIITAPDGEISPLEKIRHYDLIKQKTGTKLLYLTIVSQGSEIQTSQSKLSQGRATYIGGTVVSYTLTSEKGEYLKSGNIPWIKTNTYKRKKGANNIGNQYN